MIRTIVHHLRDSDVVGSGGEASIVIIDIADKLRVVRIPPELFRMLPRHRACNLHVVCQLVEHNILKDCVVGQDQLQVKKRRFQSAGLLVSHQTLFPFVVRCFLGKLHLGSFLPIRKSLHPSSFIIHGKLAHLLEAILVVSEFMDTHQVKGV